VSVGVKGPCRAKSRPRRSGLATRQDKKLILQVLQQVPLQYRPANISEYDRDDLKCHVNDLLFHHEAKWNAMLKEIKVAQFQQHWCLVEEMVITLLQDIVLIDLSKYNKRDTEGTMLSYYHGESAAYAYRATARFHTATFAKPFWIGP